MLWNNLTGGVEEEANIVISEDDYQQIVSLIQYKYFDGLGNDIYHGQIFIVIESFSVGLAEGGFGLNEYFVE